MNWNEKIIAFTSQRYDNSKFSSNIKSTKDGVENAIKQGIGGSVKNITDVKPNLHEWKHNVLITTLKNMLAKKQYIF